MKNFLRRIRTLFIVVLAAFAVHLAVLFSAGINPFNTADEAFKLPISAIGEKNAGNSKGIAEEQDSVPEDKNDPESIEEAGLADPDLPQDEPAAADEVQSFQSEYGKDAFSGDAAEYFLSIDELTSMEHISFSDKLAGAYLLGKIGEGDKEALYGVVKDGITYDELKEIRKMLEEYLSEREIEKLYDIFLRSKKLYAEGKADQ